MRSRSQRAKKRASGHGACQPFQVYCPLKRQPHALGIRPRPQSIRRNSTAQAHAEQIKASGLLEYIAIFFMRGSPGRFHRILGKQLSGTTLVFFMVVTIEKFVPARV